MDRPLIAPKKSRRRATPQLTSAPYDPEVVFSILDAALIAHVAFIADGEPWLVPTTYVRVERELLIHGAAACKILDVGAAGAALSASVTLVDGVVYARSAFQHAINHRSVVIGGRAREITDDDAKRTFFRALIERASPGRAAQVRAPSERELRATRLLALTIDEACVKSRAGGPVEDPEDLDIAVWAGHLPVELRARSHITMPDHAPYDPPARPRGVD